MRSYHTHVLAIFTYFGIVVPAQALEFNFLPEPGTPQEAIDGFAAAGDLWSEVLLDDITVNITIGFRPLDTGVLGSTGSERITSTFSDFVTALSQDASSNLDSNASTRLQPHADTPLMINLTSDSPNGPGSPTPYLDDDSSANNTTVRITRANAKAIGLLHPQNPAPDAEIAFNSDFNWDFDPADGIDQHSFSYIAVAAHEIGHALGFVSGIDILDGNSPPESSPFSSNLFTFVSPADLFRFSALSRGNGGAIDWAADPRLKSFAAGPGHADEAQFSLGRLRGDGQQASHWKDNLGIGLMDPTAAPGEDGQITEQDNRLFDAIGYDLGSGESTAVLCNNVELDIPDNGPALEIEFAPESNSSVTNLEVFLHLTHTWVGDLEIELTAPDGTSAILIDRPGRLDSGFGCGENNIEAHLSDTSTTSAETSCNASGVALDGQLSPNESLAAFSGLELSGSWTLTVLDHARQDVGRLESWCLSAQPTVGLDNN